MKTIIADIAGQRVEGVAALDRETVWIHLDGVTLATEATPGRAGRRGASGARAVSKNEIAAPMPGKINKVNVAVHDRVQDQQVLVVMEAMKMEYTLKAPGAGRIKEVLCKAGEQVTLGQILIKLEPST